MRLRTYTQQIYEQNVYELSVAAMTVDRRCRTWRCENFASLCFLVRVARISLRLLNVPHNENPFDHRIFYNAIRPAN